MALYNQQADNPVRLLIPARDIYAGGDICVKIPKRVIAYILGAMGHLITPDVWSGSIEQVALVVNQMEHFLATLGTIESYCEADTEVNTVYVPIYTSDGGECEAEMNCSIPYGSLRWNEGVLEYLYCGTWYPVGGGVGPVNPPITIEIDPDDPPPNTVNSSPCAMATALSSVVQDIVEEAFDEFVVSLDPLALFAYVARMQAAVPGIDLDFNSVVNMWGYVAAISAAGKASSATNTLFSAYLKCLLADIIPDGNEGISPATYAEITTRCEAAFRTAAQEIGNFGVIETSVVSLWINAVIAIGARDAQKVTFYAQPDGTENCDCPSVIEDETGESAGGWYWSQEYSFAFVAPDNFGSFIAPPPLVALEDVFGVVARIEVTSGTVNKFKRANDDQGLPGVFMFGSNSDQFYQEAHGTYCGQVVSSIAAEVFALLPATAVNGTNSYASSSNPALPSVAFGQQVNAPYALGSPSGNAHGIIHVRYLYNRNSPSHA